jgi:hypothetical protein
LTSWFCCILSCITHRHQYSYRSCVAVCTLPLQCELGEGSSVMFHKEWQFYEFNVFRGEGFPPRPTLGLYNTIMSLYAKRVDEDNLLS